MFSTESKRRFWDKVSVIGEDQCWVWTGYRIKLNGKLTYGRITIGGKLILAHRVAWMIEKGDIPDGLSVLHACDNMPCCNFRHLFLGTHIDNMNDAKAKQRFASGDRNGGRLRKGMMIPHGKYRKGTSSPQAKLTDSDVYAIRADARPQRVIAGDYGVGQDEISRIKTRKRWRHLIDPL